MVPVVRILPTILHVAVEVEEIQEVAEVSIRQISMESKEHSILEGHLLLGRVVAVGEEEEERY